MAQPDTRFRMYLKAFFTDMLTGMSGPLSVPFAALALWVSSRSQKILWGCLAVLCALFASYRVWRKERLTGNEQITALKAANERELHAMGAQKDAEIAIVTQKLAALNQKLAELSHDAFLEDVERTVRQVLDTMTHTGHLLLRHLLMNQPIEVGRPFMPEVPIERQNEQMAIAYESRIVRHNEERQGAMMRTYYIISPQHEQVLRKVLYEVLR